MLRTPLETARDIFDPDGEPHQSLIHPVRFARRAMTERNARQRSGPEVDLVILASRDTDLVPVLDEIHDLQAKDAHRYAKIETVSWFSSQARKERRFAGGSIRPTPPRRVWNTNLDRQCYEAALDPTDYR